MNNIPTFELTFELPNSLHDLLIAELDAQGFTGFIQDDDLLQAYVPSSLWTDAIKAQIQIWLQKNDVAHDITEVEIQPQDWNKAWESSIEPIKIPPFLVRPSWAPAEEGLIDIVVDPKMSFGTGHHETTRLLLRLMPPIISPDCYVLDAGAGTAILAIAAVKLGAASALAFDIDAWVEENVIENLKRNAVDQAITFRVGTIEVAPESDFDVIFANINRNVLLSYLEPLTGKLAPAGKLCLSGVLVEDKALMVDKAKAVGLSLHAEGSEGAWWAGIFSKDDANPSL